MESCLLYIEVESWLFTSLWPLSTSFPSTVSCQHLSLSIIRFPLQTPTATNALISLYILNALIGVIQMPLAIYNVVICWPAVFGSCNGKPSDVMAMPRSEANDTCNANNSQQHSARQVDISHIAWWRGLRASARCILLAYMNDQVARQPLTLLITLRIILQYYLFHIYLWYYSFHFILICTTCRLPVQHVTIIWIEMIC